MSPHTPAKQEISTKTPCQKIKGYRSMVEGILRLPCGQRIITCSSDGLLRVWNVKSGKQIGEDWKDEESRELYAIASSPDGEKVASGSYDGAVRLWDIETGKVIKKWTGHTRRVRSACWSPDGGQVVSGCEDGTARVWDVESGKTILGPIVTKGITVLAVSYSPDATMIATGGYEKSLKIWDAKTGELLTSLES